MKKIIVLITALLFNFLSGSLIGAALGSAGIGACAGFLIPLLAGQFMPSGSAFVGVFTEIWTGEMVKKLNSLISASFLDGIPDYSQYAKNDVIHLVDAGADPDVLVNNTTYPIDVQASADSDIAISLDKYQTKATPITDDELHASSYDKIAAVKDRHAEAIMSVKFTKAIHAIAPSSNATTTPVIATTGAEDTENSRLRITREDIIKMKKKFDNLQVPTVGRRLVLCSDHVNDLLLSDQKFADQYYNYQTGKISNLYGFEVYEYAGCPLYTALGNKKTFGVAATTGEFQASVAFYTKDMFRAAGSTDMYYSEAKNDPLNQRNLINFRHYFIVLPKKARAIGAIYSAGAGA